MGWYIQCLLNSLPVHVIDYHMNNMKGILWHLIQLINIMNNIIVINIMSSRLCWNDWHLITFIMSITQ